MKATMNRLAKGSGRRISEILTGASPARAHTRGQRGFTLVELLAVMAIIGILAGVVAGAVTGLSAVGTNSQIVSDTKTIETAADRFFSDAFPPVYPVVPLETDIDGNINDPLVLTPDILGTPTPLILGVQLLDFEGRLPQDPTTTFTPDFLKDIPNSAALVSYRVDTNTGKVFAAFDGAKLVRPANSRLDVKTGNAIDPATESNDRETGESSDYTFSLRMKKFEAAVEILTVEIPAGYGYGGNKLPTGSIMGELRIVFGTDNPWDSGQLITITEDILATSSNNNWDIEIAFDTNESTGLANNVNLKNPEASLADTRTHKLSVVAPTEEIPGKITLTMDRVTEAVAGDYDDPAHNEATENWTLVLFDEPILANSSLSGENIFTNPTNTGVFRWLSEEQSTIDLEGIFDRVSGLQAIVIKAP